MPPRRNGGGGVAAMKLAIAAVVARLCELLVARVCLYLAWPEAAPDKKERVVDAESGQLLGGFAQSFRNAVIQAFENDDNIKIEGCMTRGFEAVLRDHRDLPFARNQALERVDVPSINALQRLADVMRVNGVFKGSLGKDVARAAARFSFAFAVSDETVQAQLPAGAEIHAIADSIVLAFASDLTRNRLVSNVDDRLCTTAAECIERVFENYEVHTLKKRILQNSFKGRFAVLFCKAWTAFAKPALVDAPAPALGLAVPAPAEDTTTPKQEALSVLAELRASLPKFLSKESLVEGIKAAAEPLQSSAAPELKYVYDGYVLLHNAMAVEDDDDLTEMQSFCIDMLEQAIQNVQNM